MNIVLHSFSFWPAIGGVESVSHTLASGWSAAGHRVTVVTQTPSQTERATNYQVLRSPGIRQMSDLIRACDLVHSNGASSIYYLLSAIHDKPFSWTHQTYTLQCIDGFGWVNGKPAPLNPAQSLGFHWHELGAWKALSGAAKLWMRRSIGNVVSANVAISNHQAMIQPLPRQTVIYNPIDIDRFSVSGQAEAMCQLSLADATFTFIGRLITEKGVSDLLHAFAQVFRAEQMKKGGRPLTLKIIGDGPEQSVLKNLAEQLGIAARVKWLGAVSGSNLLIEIEHAGICVLPSAWQEPMGIIAVELMAAGKPLIVSALGGLAECAEDACLTFPNQNVDALAQAMLRLYRDKTLQTDLVTRSLRRVKNFEPEKTTGAYLDLFAQIKSAAQR